MPKHRSLEEQRNVKIVFENLLEDQKPLSLQLIFLFRGYHVRILATAKRGRQDVTVWHKEVGMLQLSHAPSA